MATEYLPDTNILISAWRGTSNSVLNRMAGLAPQRLHLSSLVWAELLTGVEKQTATAPKRRVALQELTNGMTALPFDELAASSYAKIRTHLENKGLAIGPMDLLIAAQALSRGLVLVTDNLREFRRVPDLVCENWLR